MSGNNQGDPALIRARLSHPVIDSDGHWVEYHPTIFDYLKKVRRPFQILPGGYMSVFKNGRWTQIFGSRAKARRFARENRRGHRSTYRGRTHRMRRSRPRG